MKSYLLIALALALLSTNALAQDGCGSTFLGTGSWAGKSCPLFSCSPNPTIPSPTIYVSFPGGAGTATIPSGWIEAGDADAFGACNNPAQWTTHGFGSIVYNDGTISYSGAVAYDIAYADTVVSTGGVALPSGSICCWNVDPAHPSVYLQPKSTFIYKLKLRSCTASHTLTNRFFAVGCDGCVTPAFVNDPNCPFSNLNYINLTVSGF